MVRSKREYFWDMEETKPTSSDTKADISEKELKLISGFTILMINLMIIVFGIFLMVGGGSEGSQLTGPSGFFLILIGLVMLSGYFQVAPSEAKLLLLLGQYRGSVKKHGFYWTSPLTKKTSISLKEELFLSPSTLVQDQSNLPLITHLSVLWQVSDTTQAAFGQSSLPTIVEAEAMDSIKELSAKYPYTHPTGSGQQQTLSSADPFLSQQFAHNMAGRLRKHGLACLKAQVISIELKPGPLPTSYRLAEVESIMAVRAKILSKAISLAEQAVKKMEEKEMVRLNDATRAKFISDLVVTLSRDDNSQSHSS